jgi:ATP-dependent RNA helicase SUPV3L1/SUV3
VLDPALARSMGLTTASYAALLRQAGFRAAVPRPLAEGQAGPPAPPLWHWRPPGLLPWRPQKARQRKARGHRRAKTGATTGDRRLCRAG